MPDYSRLRSYNSAFAAPEDGFVVIEGYHSGAGKLCVHAYVNGAYVYHAHDTTNSDEMIHAVGAYPVRKGDVVSAKLIPGQGTFMAIFFPKRR